MKHDLILVGGGLSSCLLAYRLARKQAGLKILILEAAQELGGNHTWSFHASDLDPAQQAWIDPFICHRWSGYAVRFPGYTRRLKGGYCSITADSLRQVMKETTVETRVGATVETVTPTTVTLTGGEQLPATAVIDARGQRQNDAMVLGFQSFLGQEIKFEEPHGLSEPVLMDATVPQKGGYRFVYLLPFTNDTLLIEDTYYADNADLEPALLRARIADYADQQGWQNHTVEREETGVLPILLAGDIERILNDRAQEAPTIGLAGGFFHASTGYSLPDAVRVADAVAGLSDLQPQTLSAKLERMARRHWRRQGFYRLLNRMLFLASKPSERRRIMARFYRLPEGLIENYYAGRTTYWEKLRILTGKPPIPIRRAVSVIPPRSARRVRPAGS